MTPLERDTPHRPVESPGMKCIHGMTMGITTWAATISRFVALRKQNAIIWSQLQSDMT